MCFAIERPSKGSQGLPSGPRDLPRAHSKSCPSRTFEHLPEASKILPGPPKTFRRLPKAFQNVPKASKTFQGRQTMPTGPPPDLPNDCPANAIGVPAPRHYPMASKAYTYFQDRRLTSSASRPREAGRFALPADKPRDPRSGVTVVRRSARVSNRSVFHACRTQSMG